MNKVATFVLAIMMLGIFALSCSVSSDEKAYKELLSDDLKAAKSEIQDLNQKVTKLEADYKTLQASDAQLKLDYGKLQSDYTGLQDKYNKLITSASKSEVKNVTWTELAEIISREDTNLQKYQDGVFESEGFALVLRDHMTKVGVRCAFVSISEGTGKRALNAFETTDKGIIYVDCAGSDSIAYVQQGKQYGTICLAGVKADYIVCEGKPEEFWNDLVWGKHDNLLSYDYYESIIQRQEYYKTSLAAYDKAKADYDKGFSQLTDATLSAWKFNLNKLKEDLGPCSAGPGGTVSEVVIYWN